MNKPRQQPCLSHSTLFWDDTGTPRSAEFGDIYYSRQDGIAETDHVFLRQNQLEERWKAFSADERSFVIAETGFGTGLNFLCAWHLWRSLPETRNKTLHFVSFEKYPVTLADIKQALKRREDTLCYEASALASHYPPPLKGIHRLNFDDGRVKLTLVFDDVNEGLESNHFFADAWFLDGFAPDKNPQMWQDALLEQIALHSRQGATLSTFTCVGRIRRALIEQGFDVKKVKGFGSKREMLAGKYCPTYQKPDVHPVYFNKKQPGFNPVMTSLKVTDPHSLPVTVVGGGLAGAWSAFALAQRGIKVNLIEQHKNCGLAASGNPQGILYCKPGREFTTQTQLGLHGCLYSGREFARLEKQRAGLEQGASPIWSATGTALLAVNDKILRDQNIILTGNNYSTDIIEPLNPEQVSEKSGTQIDYSALLLKPSGWANPAEICRILCKHPDIKVINNTRVTDLRFCQEKQLWDVVCKTGSNESPFTICSGSVILATAENTRSFTQTCHFPIKSIKGQISRFSLADNKTQSLKLVLCGEGYVCPPVDNDYCFGATFNLNDNSPDITRANHDKNMVHLRQLAPRLADEIELDTGKQIRGRTGFRCATADYLPIVGPAPVYDDFLSTFAPLRSNAKMQLDCDAPYHPGLFVNFGHGSKGLATCPLAAEIIAGYMLGEPMPAQQNILSALHPARFLVRGLKRNTL
ncbi:MAG: bifunctional tRNA (5-methylaminomethyl-2-thiouridine)(34)-methyltransferase MnmD/FAD-dependent 5-carboxymethylaminomethyl-2-thiouridine(34) oxidoreductase MnmC [Proteobacteria bacterium]|nr:MAG: bifunctional tRNA (5-methylaminomethyl-2-thiouridine)(34)-methyltransferase MnmD/FAD-dependent 5-carboxymethylaminomethyl-2-thiouridine(34) oxidoreductase MnmC [Pseudomonadota bacterium]